jgi:CheY-like chemotaxis protein
MDICCPRCGGLAEPAGHEDARAFYRCPTCDRIWAAYISAAAQPSAPHPSRVLVADDSPEMLGLLTAWLEDEGCMVIAVGTGREAIDAAATYHPDAAFLDVVLPPPDGIQVAESLTRGPGMGVVLMTGMSNPDRKRIAESGALLLLEKPFEREALMDALTLALDYGRRNDPNRHAAAG